MSTEQQDTREQQIETLARLACEVENGGDETAWGDENPIDWPDGESARAWYRDRAEYLLGDPLVARMIADAEQAAERRGAVAASRHIEALLLNVIETVYPVEVFGSLGTGEMKTVQAAVEARGFTLDSVSAHVMRFAYRAASRIAGENAKVIENGADL